MPDRVRMPLLTLITQQSLDEDYQQAAERRAAGAPRAPLGRPPRVAAVVVMVFGILVATAFVQTSRNADIDSASRATLIERVEAGRERRARQENRVVALRGRVEQLERSTSKLTDETQADAVTLRRQQIRTGFIAVTGEGVRVTVFQNPDADKDAEITDRDLRLLVNGLFAAGAEAIAVNGQRITATTGIRTSGRAVGVNFVGIAPPFTVDAIGDKGTLSARFLETTPGQNFAANAEIYAFDFAMANVDDHTLPSAPASRQVLRSATVPTQEDRTTEKGGTS
ncbi:MAG: DUF881 domain-containing protein [Herbiconiux sp.]|nr:DUF881 domain-containing protein [Herbiconiux sp.]